MAKIRLIEDAGEYHIHVLNIDFWLRKQDLLDLYAALLPYVKKGGV